MFPEAGGSSSFARHAFNAALNIRGIGESAKLNFFLAIADLATQVLIIIIGAFLVLKPSLLINQVHLGSEPARRPARQRAPTAKFRNRRPASGR
jgi:amino acid transporter